MMLMLLLLMWGRVSLADPQCERSSAVRVSVSSWRNQTGHRLLAAVMRYEDSPEDAVSLYVNQWTEQCGPANTVALSLTASSGKSTDAAIATILPTVPAPYTTTTPVTAQPTSRSGYRHIAGYGYYKLHDTTMTWEEGRRICESEGAYLAVLETWEEFDAVYNFSGCCPWIGVYRQDNSSLWMTVLGKPLETSGYTVWLPGYPGKFGDCALFDRSTVQGINNFKCSTLSTVLCEQNV